MKDYIVSIGGGILQEKLIEEIKNLGYKSIVFDKDENCPGTRKADVFMPISTRDYENILRYLHESNLLEKVRCAITVGTDMSLTVAKINEIVAPYLVNSEVALKTTNKFLMRETLKEGNVNVPEYFLVKTLDQSREAFQTIKAKTGHYCVIKPVDNMGARGVRRIYSEKDIDEIFLESVGFSYTGNLLIEECIEGSELSVDALVYKGEVLITGIADRIIEYDPYFVETGHIMPTNLPKTIVDRAIEEFKKAIKVIGIVNGAAKGDLKISQETGEVFIGEIASRLSGGFMSTHTFPFSTGVNLMKNIILLSLGEEPEINHYEYKLVSVERAIIPYKGIVKEIKGVEEAQNLENIKYVYIKAKTGDIFLEPKNNLDKAGNVIGVGRTREEAIRNVNRAIEKIKIITEIPEDKKSFFIIPSEEEIKSKAKSNFNGACYVCKECNGEACRGKVPGIGGIGTGETFVENYKRLKRYKLRYRYIHDATDPDISVELLGYRLEMPVVVSPVTGTKTNLGGIIDELEYIRWIMKGATYAGTIAMIGDSATPEKYKVGIRGLLENYGRGIGIYKPRSDKNEILKRIKEAEEAGAIAVGMDIDGAAFITMRLKNQSVEPKSLEKLKDIISSTKLPFVVKGVMTPEDAILAVEAGAKVVMVSNHGGRVGDSMMATIDVLEEIVEAIKGSDVIVGVDGGFRSGSDVVKALCLGAKFVGIGRPVTIAAFGGGVDGVKQYLEKIKDEIKQNLKLLGAKRISDLSKSMIRVV